MSEIKGQLLGIVMVLIIFGAVSGPIAGIFYTTREKITEKSTDMTTGVENTLKRPMLSYND